MQAYKWRLDPIRRVREGFYIWMFITVVFIIVKTGTPKIKNLELSWWREGGRSGGRVSKNSPCNKNSMCGGGPEICTSIAHLEKQSKTPLMRPKSEGEEEKTEMVKLEDSLGDLAKYLGFHSKGKKKPSKDSFLKQKLCFRNLLLLEDWHYPTLRLTKSYRNQDSVEWAKE